MAGLFPHNQKVYDMVLGYFEEINKVAVVQATGTGKGYLASEFVNVAFKNKNILILAPNNDILTNYKMSLGVEESPKIKMRTYAGIDSLYKHNKEDFKRLGMSVDLLIVDEFHRLGATEWGASAKVLIDLVGKQGKILGLTATPVRYNDTSILNNPHISDEEKMNLRKARNMADEIFGGNVVQGISLEEAVYSHILPSFKYVLGSYGYETAIAEGFEKLENLKELYGSSNPAIKKLEKQLNEVYTRFGSEKDNLRKLICNETKDLGDYQKWIVFCESAEQLKSIDDKLAYWFNKPINKYNSNFSLSSDKINLYSVYSGADAKLNDMNLKAFYKANSGLNIIKCINKLNEGAHVSNITGIIMLRSTLSPIVYLQQIGRALSAGNKNNPIIFDFMGNIENMQKINNGEDSYINSIRKSANLVSEYNKLGVSSGFLSEPERAFYKKDYKYSPSIRIVDKNVVQLSSLFSGIQDILHSHSSLTWSEFELSVLDKYYPMGGAERVQYVLKRKSLSSRSIDAINKKAKERGLLYDVRTGNVVINKDNSLEWTPDENKRLLEAFNLLLPRGLNVSQICAKLHDEVFRNRTPNQIFNQYEKIKNGRASFEEFYPRTNCKWSDDDIYTLKSSYKHNIPIKIIAKELGRHPESVKRKAQKLELYSVKRTYNHGVKDWSDEEKMFLLDNLDKMTLTEIARHLDRSVSSVSNKLERLNRDTFVNNYINTYHKSSKNPRKWTIIEETKLEENWGTCDWATLCTIIDTRTPKQIRRKVLEWCNQKGLSNPYKHDIEFKKIS